MGVPISRVPECVSDGTTVTLVNANQEYSVTLPVGVHRFSMQPRKNAGTEMDVNFAFATGLVPPGAGHYFTMKAGAPYTEKDEDLETQLTIYLSCQTAGTVVEITYWR